MRLNLAIGLAVVALAVIGPVGRIPARSALPGGAPACPEVTPSLVVTALLEKTIFQVDVVSLELWLGPAGDFVTSCWPS